MSLLICNLFILPVQSAEEFSTKKAYKEVVVVKVKTGSTTVVSHLGVIVSPGAVLTSDFAIRKAKSITVNVLNGPDIPAQIANYNKDTGVALLIARGLTAKPAKFSKERAISGRQVNVIDIGAASIRHKQGTIGNAVSSDQTKFLFDHNAIISAAGYGGPVFDECGWVIGLNRPDPKISSYKARSGMAPSVVVRAVNNQTLVNYTKSLLGTAITVSTEKCPSIEERRQTAAAKIKATEKENTKNKEALNKAEKTAKNRKAASDKQKKTADKKIKDAEETKKALEEEIATAETSRLKAEEDLKDAREEEQRQLFLIIAGGVLLVIVILGIAIMMIKKRSRLAAAAMAEADVAFAEADAADARAAQAASQKADVFFDCLLEGGHHSLKLPGAFLPDASGGVIIGRHPGRSSVVFDTPEISRSHARFYEVDGTVYVEDLGSANGTQVNGMDVVQGRPLSITPGDQVVLGGFAFTFSVLG